MYVDGPKRQPVMSSDPRGLGRYVLIGCLVATVAALVVVGGGLLVAGVDAVDAAGIAAVAACWGGLGFGGMLGGVAYVTKVQHPTERQGTDA